MLVISGIFNKSSAYTCRFESTNPFAIGQVLSAVARPDSDGNLACTAPTWTLGAQEVILSVLIAVGDTGSDAVDVRGVLPGPEIGDRISYVAVWRTKSEATGAAQGGTSISIDGFGFDKNDADYVCKFLCIHSSCSSLPAQRFAVSEVPKKPISDKRVTCVTPPWLFNAFSGGGLMNVGTTKVVLEKGGVELTYVGTSAAGQEFLFNDEWIGADKEEGLATMASTFINIDGYGFDVSAQDYACVFSFTDSLPYIYAGAPAIALSSKLLQCPSPHWTTVETMTKIEVFKENCRGARGSSTSAMCNSNNKVNLKSGLVRFKFASAVQNLSAASGPASAGAAGRYTITINGGGFTPAASGYSVVFEQDLKDGGVTSPSQGENNSVEINVTGIVG